MDLKQDQEPFRTTSHSTFEDHFLRGYTRIHPRTRGAMGVVKNELSEPWITSNGNDSVSDADRYKTSAALEEAKCRKAEREKREKNLDMKREAVNKREMEKQAFEDERRRIKEEYYNVKREQNKTGKGSVGYNPINGQVYNTIEGRKFQDQQEKLESYRRARGMNAYKKFNTYDPIKGIDLE